MFIVQLFRKDDAMDNAMTPSGITDPQITKLTGNIRSGLEKYRKEFPTEASQIAIGSSECMKEMLAVFRKHVEAVSKSIIRTAKVNRSQTFKQAIDATNRVQYVNDDVVATAPKVEGDFEGFFFNFGRNVDFDKLDESLASIGLELIVDPQGLAQINADDPEFADKHPNGIQWKNANGKYCYVVFDRCEERDVEVDHGDDDWDDGWWFPCRRISTQALDIVS